MNNPYNISFDVPWNPLMRHVSCPWGHSSKSTIPDIFPTSQFASAHPSFSINRAPMKEVQMCRGKSILTGDWVEGQCVVYGDRQYFTVLGPDGRPSFCEVVSGTVRRAVGKMDMNGNWLFEKDIVENVDDGSLNVIVWFNEDNTFGMRRIHPDDDLGDRQFRIRFADKWEGIRLAGMAE